MKLILISIPLAKAWVCLVYELSEDDFDRRKVCEQMQELCTNDNNFVKNVIFSDEATFISNGHVNRQNCRCCATENPRWMMEYHTQRPKKVNVWCGIVDGRILGPYFFDVHLTGASYLDFLRDDLIPELITLYPDIEERSPTCPCSVSVLMRNTLYKPRFGVRLYFEDSNGASFKSP
ncbi:hypothetical protein NQ318_022448 [Aromia moschata]|uniref:Transposase n=1 Tax=Aromia moschata TaxID=1265417 RepID=A0AAV8Z6M6_9CUCU|nr:hypothetical protein NQ318_022448 [Aromia moschata]